MFICCIHKWEWQLSVPVVVHKWELDVICELNSISYGKPQAQADTDGSRQDVPFIGQIWGHMWNSHGIIHTYPWVKIFAYVINHALYLSVADINECESSPCLNSCTCVDDVNGYSCGTFAGYTGTHCETGKQFVNYVYVLEHTVDLLAWIKFVHVFII